MIVDPQLENLKTLLVSGAGLPLNVRELRFGLTMSEFVDQYRDTLCSFECFVFNAVSASHGRESNRTLNVLRPSYMIKQWSDGRFDSMVVECSISGLISLGSLKIWAQNMLALNRAFADMGVTRPVLWLQDNRKIARTLNQLAWTILN